LNPNDLTDTEIDEHEVRPIPSMTVIKGMLVFQEKLEMSDWLKDPNVQLAAGLAILCILTTVGFSLVSRFRDYAAQDRDDTLDALANLEEMHLKGDISEEEFRTIQAKAETLSACDPAIDVSASPDESSGSSHTA
jgi:hypothetical protein